MSPFLRLGLFALLGVAAAALGGWVVDPRHAALLVKHGGGWLIATWFALWVGTAWWVWRADWRVTPGAARAWWQSNWSPVVAVLAASGFVLTREPFGFKVTMDELVLGSTAMSLHFGRLASATMRSYELQGFFQDFGHYLDKRPLFFPWLASLLHDFTGYRVANLFALNAGLTVALFTLIYQAGRWLRDRRTGLLAVLLLAGLPLLAQNSTGAGFELLNVVMLLLTLLASARYLREPRPATQAFLIFSVILLANSRYESALFVAAAGVVIVGEWILRRRILLGWALWGAPFAFVPVLWHLRVFSLSADFWQLPAGVTSPFALSFFYDNIGHFLSYLADLRSSSSPILALGAVLGFGFAGLYATRYWVKRAAAEPERLAWWAFVAGMALNLAVLFCYHWGQVDQVEVSRLLLPFFTLGALAAAWMLGEFSLRPAVWRGVALAAALSIYAFTLPVTSRAIYTRSNYFAQRMAWTWDFHQQLPAGNYLYFAQGPLIFTLNQVSALNIASAPSAAAKVKHHVDHGTFDAVFMVQNIFIHPDTGEEQPVPDNDPGAAYQLERVAQRSFRPYVVTRISRVVGIDPAAAPPPPAPGTPAASHPLGTKEPGQEMDYDDAAWAKRWIEQLP